MEVYARTDAGGADTGFCGKKEFRFNAEFCQLCIKMNVLNLVELCPKENQTYV